MFDFSAVIPHLPQLLVGLASTLLVSLTAIALGLVFGWAICLGLTGHRAWLCRVCAVYVSFFRGTPLLVQLILVFYALPAAGISLPPLAAAVLALTLNTAAFQGEILRSGFQMLPQGQLEAARDLGLSPLQTLLQVQIPQVLRSMLPALTNETIDIIKNSALVSAVAVHELMRTAQTLASTTYRPIEFFAVAGLLYLLVTLCTGRLSSWLEARLRTA
ncbi:amino acid ABC transporter permease [Stutzerimonas stutzeri]|uniref:Amino acid ABC transporter permease n=1 Tax=Stutzerimonas stutzeri TaxID=316 RepID=A0A2N8RCU4_STUST|nr:amino acid ABC transporter permease [Stutzerimonas stutzeri]MCQ4254707.1 amino acid ABC transporter permease [Stutzerimonas stutzeri]PNF58908.1 amino acid ABC transporter permease [Stutzerimonas stutzeri]